MIFTLQPWACIPINKSKPRACCISNSAGIFGTRAVRINLEARVGDDIFIFFRQRLDHRIDHSSLPTALDQQVTE